MFALKAKNLIARLARQLAPADRDAFRQAAESALERVRARSACGGEPMRKKPSQAAPPQRTRARMAGGAGPTDTTGTIGASFYRADERAHTEIAAVETVTGSSEVIARA